MADFLNTLPALDERQRAWLHETLSTLYGTHDTPPDGNHYAASAPP